MIYVFNTFFLDEKSIQKNHDYGSVVREKFLLFKVKVAKTVAKKVLVKELATLRQPLLAPFFNGLLVAPSPMSVLTLVNRFNKVRLF